MEENSELNKLIMQIIAFSGDSISYSMSALDKVVEKNYEEADKLIEEAEATLRKAHQAHTDILVYEANNQGKNIVSCLLVHASTHLANAELSKELTKKIIKIMQQGGEKSD